MGRRSKKNFTAAGPGVEQRALEFLKGKMKELQIRPSELAEALDPPLSESQLRHLLNGGSSLNLDRFFQITKLMQIDPFEVLHHSNPDPKFEMPFSREQEIFLASDPWHFRLMKALGMPRTEKELVELFPECPRVSNILKLLLEKKIIEQRKTPEKIVYRVHASAFQLATIDFVEGYTQMLLANTRDVHETTVLVDAHRRDLIKYVRNVMAIDYLTPEQMMTLRERLIAVFAEFRRFVGQNRMDSAHSQVAKENLVCLITLMAPLNRKTFLK